MLWQLLHHSDNHGNSLKKTFFEKDDFSDTKSYPDNINNGNRDSCIEIPEVPLRKRAGMQNRR